MLDLLNNDFKELFTLEINREKYLKNDGKKWVNLFLVNNLKCLRVSLIL